MKWSALVLFAAGAASGDASAPATAKPPSAVVLTADQARACFGDFGFESPSVIRLGEAERAFENACRGDQPWWDFEIAAGGAFRRACAAARRGATPASPEALAATLVGTCAVVRGGGRPLAPAVQKHASSLARACVELHSDFVTPTAADVSRIQAGLLRAVAEAAAKEPAGSGWRPASEVLARLPSDVRYYVGTPDTIVVFGYCKRIVERGGGQPPCPPRVADGGSCIWQIEFDPKSGTFSKFGTNGLG